jgi:hypothetical protein
MSTIRRLTAVAHRPLSAAYRRRSHAVAATRTHRADRPLNPLSATAPPVPPVLLSIR